MAEEEIEQEGSAGDTPASGKKNVIFFAIALFIAVGGSVGGTFFFLSAGDDASVATKTESTTNKPRMAIYYNMRPAYIVNYLTGAKPRYLQAEFTIMARNEDAVEAVVLHMPLIRSEIINYLTDQNFLELQTQEGKEVVRQGIVLLVNEILASYNVEPGIESTLITNFVLQ